MSGSAWSGTGGVRDPDGLAITVFADLAALPADARALFGGDVFSTLGWYRATCDAALPAGVRGEFLCVSQGGSVLAVFPMRRGPGARDFSALTTPYTGVWRPLLRPGLDAASVSRVFVAFARACAAFPLVRLDAMEAASPGLLDGARAAGLLALRFDHFGNWHGGGAGWAGYLAARPGALRESIRRRTRRLMGESGARPTVVDGPEGLEAGIAAYENVYAASWKPREPFPRFTAALMREAAGAGTLRLGLLHMRGVPVAAQLWLLLPPWAGVLKLAHDEVFRSHSPGTVLMALMIERMFSEGAAEIDFGRGDDDYKKLWADERRQRVGVVLANPRTPAGAAAAIRHGFGTLIRRSARA